MIYKFSSLKAHYINKESYPLFYRPPLLIDSKKWQILIMFVEVKSSENSMKRTRVAIQKILIWIPRHTLITFRSCIYQEYQCPQITGPGLNIECCFSFWVTARLQSFRRTTDIRQITKDTTLNGCQNFDDYVGQCYFIFHPVNNYIT